MPVALTSSLLILWLGIAALEYPGNMLVVVVGLVEEDLQMFLVELQHLFES